MNSSSFYINVQNYNIHDQEKLKERELQKLINQETSFSWVHGGRLMMPIIELKHIITKYGIKIPRTGHLGNWIEIKAGNAGALDHNATSCQLGFAFPYLFDLNQTENDTSTSGDSVYMVGSLIKDQERIILPLYTWNGHEFEERNREKSYFVPFTITLEDGRKISLCELQKNNNLDDIHIKYSSSILLDHEDKLRSLLHSLISSIRSNQNSDLLLSDLIDREVQLNGTVSRVEACVNKQSIIVGNCIYHTVDEFIDGLLVPIKAAAIPGWFLRNVDKLPNAFPFMSLALFSCIDFLFSQSGDEFRIYAEWGAFGSAAYPPRSKGYYKQKSGLIKKIIDSVMKESDDKKSIFFLLLPSSIFNLLPCDAYPDDVEYINALFNEVIKKTSVINIKNSRLFLETIEEIAAEWWKSNYESLSTYFKGRYEKARCVYHKTGTHKKAKAVLLPEFEQLSLQQASMLVGGLFRAGKIYQGSSYET